MSYYLRVWSTGELINLVETDSFEITENHMPDQRSAVITTAEVEGDYLDAGAIAPLLSVVGNVISGIAIISQVTEQNLLQPLTVGELLQEKRERTFLTRMQFMLALNAAGMLEQVETLITDPLTTAEVKIMWQHASTFDRMYPELIQMATALGLTDIQIDTLFGI